VGNLNQAITLYEQAVALDPLRAASHVSQGYLLYVAGRYDGARAALQKALELNAQSAYVHADLAKILIYEGKPQQALAQIEKEPIEWQRLECQVLGYRALGREQESNAVLAALIAKHQNDAAYQIAEVYAFRGDSDKSFSWLERAYQQRDTGLPKIKTDPLLNNLRPDPRFKELLKKLHLPTQTT